MPHASASDDAEMKDTATIHAPDATTDIASVQASSASVDGVEAPPQPPVLDALPYLDVEYAQDPHLQEMVKQMLQAEMMTMTRQPEEYLRDYLQRSDTASSAVLQAQSHFTTPLLTAAFEALEKNTPPLSGLDLTRYRLEAPASGSDPQAWADAIANAQAQLEHQTNRAVNLELLKKFGASAWKTHNEQLTHLKSQLAASLDSVRGEVETVNRKRKSEQVAAGADFALLENSYHHLVHKNHQIETAIWQLKERLGLGSEQHQSTHEPPAQAAKQQKVA